MDEPDPLPHPTRPWWKRSDGIAVLLLATVLGGAFWYLVEGTKPWETKWESRVEAGKLPGLNDDIECACWVAAALIAAVATVLLALAPWWVRRGGEKTMTERLPFRPLGAGRSGRGFWWCLFTIVVLGMIGPVSRLPMTLWGDEEWAFRDFVHGKWLPEDGKGGDLQGVMVFEPYAWKRTLFYNHGGNNHILFSALNRTGQEVWRASSDKPRDHYSELWAKAFPAVPFAVATLVVLACLFRWLGQPAVGLTAAALYSLHPLAVRFASEARGYSMVTTFVLAAVWFALRACERARWRDWALLSLAEFLAIATWSTAIFPVLALNLFVLLFLFRQRGGFSGAALGRWLVTGSFAAMAFFPLYGPHVPQVSHASKMRGMVGAPMDSRWLTDSLSRLGSGMLYYESQPENDAQVSFVERRRIAPTNTKIAATILAASFFIGCIALTRRYRSGALLLLAPVLGLPIAFAAHRYLLHVELRYWYQIYAYPVVFATAAAGVIALADELPSTLRKTARLALPSALVLGFGWLIAPIYASNLKYPYESLRKSVAMTRGLHEPLPPEGMDSLSNVVTVRIWRHTPLYDPRAHDHIRDAASLEALSKTTRDKGGELYVVSGLHNYIRGTSPDLYKLLHNPEQFEKLGVLPSDDPLFTLHIYHHLKTP